MSTENTPAPELAEHELAEVARFGLDTMEGTPMTDTTAGDIAEDRIKVYLRNALVANDRIKLPPYLERVVGLTHADLRASYLDFYTNLFSMLRAATNAHMLIRIKDHSPELADKIAIEVNEWSEAGDAYPEWIWDWADERGMKPDVLVVEGRARYAEWLASEVTQ